MKTLLHVSASPRGPDSQSGRYGRELIAALQMGQTLQVVHRDLGIALLPYPDADFVAASLMVAPERSAAQIDALSLSECLIAELEAADAVVIDTPMHNFTLPAVLKTWIDHVVRPSRTFGIGSEGKRGLLRNRPVHGVIACGGGCGDQPGAQIDFLTPYLTYALATIGLTDLRILRLEGLRRGEAAIARAHHQAMDWIASQIQG